MSIPARPRPEGESGHVRDRRRIMSLDWSDLVRVAGTAMFLAFIFYSLDLRSFWLALKRPDRFYLALMVAAALLYMFLNALKLWVLLLAFRRRVSLLAFLGIFLVCGSVSSLAPAIFGDLTMVGMLRRRGLSVREIFSAVFVDRYLTLVLAVFVFLPGIFRGVYSFSFLGVYGASLAFFVCFLLVLRGVGRFIGPLSVRFPRVGGFAGTVMAYFRQYRRLYYLNMAIGLLKSFVAGITVAFALRAAGSRPALWDAVCVTNALALFTHIPVSLGGLGFYEGAGMLIFAMLGLNKERAAAGLFYQRAYVVLSSVLVITVTLVSWLVESWRRRRRRDSRF